MRLPGTAARRLGAGLVLALLLVGWGAWQPAWANRASRITPVVRVVRAVSPAVVNISTVRRQRMRIFSTGDRFMDRFFEDFFGPMQREQRTLGSGVIIDGKKGLIATNSHVVHQATVIKVQLADKRTYRAEVVGADPDSDLAVLRIHPKGVLPQVRLGDSDDLMIGESIIAIGNPFGLSHTVTVGVVSALGRKVRAGSNTWLHDLIQTDASINPGNSGGPLLNTDGEMIGINTAIYQNAQGIGFAIPVNRVKRVVDDLVRFGEVIPVWLGLDLQELNPALAAHFGLERPQGVLVLQVMKDSPAAAAGLKRGDLILTFNGHRLEGISDYAARLGGLAAGDLVKLGLKGRKGRRSLTLKARAFPLERAMEVAWRRLGFTVSQMSRALARRHGVPPGSAVAIQRLRPGSQALRIGLRPGDLIRQVGDRPTPNLAAFQRQIARYRLLRRITVLVQRGRASQFITLGPG